MKKLWIISASCLLAACYCQTRSSCSAGVQPVVTKAQTVPTEISAPTLVVTQQHAEKAPVPPVTTPTAPQKPSTQIAKEQAPVTVSKQTDFTGNIPVIQRSFNTKQAADIIAHARAQQTLQNPPTDTPSFKKEPILPTEGRLLNPLAYEPVLPDNTHAPWSNESLKYGIYYSFVKAGTAYIKTRGLTNANGKKAYLIQTTAFSASVIDSVFKVRDINYSWLDANTFHSLGYSQSVREGNYKRDEWVTFDNENGRFYGQVQKKKEPKLIAGLLDIEVLDILSSLYYVRTQPLEVGKDVTFDIINREKQYPLVVKVLGKETVKIEAGKFNCWVVEPQFRGEGIFVAKGKSLKVWLTDDKYRMPVKMSVEVFIGSVYAELLEYQRN